VTLVNARKMLAVIDMVAQELGVAATHHYDHLDAVGLG
jgi:hypothetical protein